MATDGPTSCEEIAAALDALDAETDSFDEVWDERPPRVARLVDLAEAHQCAQLAERLKWEAMLAYAYTSNVALLDADRPRFTNFHPDLLGDAALDYLVTRASVGSAHVRGRVLDFLWEHGGASRKRHAVGAAAAYLDVAKLEADKASSENFGWLRVGDALVRAAQLAKAANQRNLMRDVAAQALALSRELAEVGNWRHVLDSGLALTELASTLTPVEAESVATILSDAAVVYLRDGNYHLARAALTERRRFAQARKLPAEVVGGIDLEIAQSCLREGEQREGEGSNLIASVAYNSALEMLESIGADKTLIERARSAVRRTREAGIGEMTRITTRPIELTQAQQKHIAGVIDAVSGADAPDCFRLIAMHPELLLRRADTAQHLASMRSAAPLTQLLPRVLLRDGGQALAPSDPTQAERFRLLQHAVTMVRIEDGLYLRPIIERLLDRTDMGPEVALAHIASGGHVPDHCLPIIEVGIRRLWARDWVSALHILVPQLEEVMRSMLRRTGHDTMRTHRDIPGITVEVPLGYVLDQLAGVILDDDVIFMLEVVLDLYGLNLRNQFGHGLVTIGDCGLENAGRVLQLYLILCELRPSEAPGDAPGPDG